MTEQDRDPKVSQRYRELGAQEPPRALDDAILAAARRSARPWTQRWAVPLSLAAVIVLSVTVTLRIQHEQPGIEVPVPQAAPARTVEPAAEPSTPVAQTHEVKIPRRKAAEQPAPAVAAAPADPAPPVPREPKPFARQAEERTSRDAEAVARAPQVGPVQALKRVDMPERELERIAELRGQGRHDEADRALAEFRKRYPNYRIPEAMRERVERR